ncbi:hypothetical protein [Mycolicibacterium porcinum]|uniref:DUF3757 domain-containing protein n=1 Tax=Mycolicibacterium porcinum TaxID=39693 RepID=A0AAW5STS0_9MYCO|nr:hypothetical protein [Mycolicibacterium porcinum]MCV7386495.1 hypothetical protein [Mycolicibacterium porcinum]ORB39012.1 hypothetical protein BST41_18520 [Mycolicibacterium porcinum]
MIKRTFAFAVVMTAASLNGIAPASADLLGLYRFHGANGDTSTWSFVPCGPGCIDVGITENSNIAGRFIGKAKFEDGLWNMTVDVPTAVRCELNQRLFPGRLEYYWDEAALTGTSIAVQTTPNCGRPAMARMEPIAFTLEKA